MGNCGHIQKSGFAEWGFIGFRFSGDNGTHNMLMCDNIEYKYSETAYKNFYRNFEKGSNDFEEANTSGERKQQ
jgi:hypothetical protein